MRSDDMPLPAGPAAGLAPVWAKALGEMRYGLYFLTTGTVAAPLGMLISWVSQVSGQPPMILVSVRENRSLLADLEREGAFALNLLPAAGEGLLEALGRKAERRFQGVELSAGPLGLPVLASGLGALCCQVGEVWRPGDHALFLGRVQGALWRGGGPSLETQAIGHYYLGLS